MAHSLSAKKRMRQNEKRRQRNRARISVVKKRVRRVLEAVRSKDAPAAETALREAAAVIDRTASRGTLHRNTAARRKSRLARQVNAVRKAAAAG